MFHTVLPVRQATFVLLLFMLALTLVACGDISHMLPGLLSEETAPLSRLDSCALLPKTDIEVLLGAQVAAYNSAQFDDPTLRDEEAISQCLYYAVGGHKRLIVQLWRGAANQSARANLHRIVNTNVLGGAVDPVPELGDEALWLHSGDSDDQLNVALGQYLVTISADLGAGIPTKEIARAAAERALARLP